jgi:hypothetical protein
MRVQPRELHDRCGREPAQAPGGGVPVHPGPAGVEQDRSGRAVTDGSVDRPAHCRRKWEQHVPGALADHAQHPVTVFLAQVANVGAGGLEDPQWRWSRAGASPSRTHRTKSCLGRCARIQHDARGRLATTTRSGMSGRRRVPGDRLGVVTVDLRPGAGRHRCSASSLLS